MVKANSKGQEKDEYQAIKQAIFDFLDKRENRIRYSQHVTIWVLPNKNITSKNISNYHKALAERSMILHLIGIHYVCCEKKDSVQVARISPEAIRELLPVAAS